MKLLKIFLSIFISSLFFAPWVSTAETQKMTFDDETLQKIYDYRIAVEKDAYQTTSQLCTAYKYASNLTQSMGTAYPPFLGANYEHLHRRNETLGTTISDEESLLSSIQAWSKIAREGVSQPFSAMFGIKADVIEKTNTSLFDWDSWFKSMYSIFLIQSPGFIEAVQTCLNTENADDIVQFASTILVFDSVASLPGHAVTFLSIGAVIGGLFKAIMWAGKPAIKAGSSFYGKIKNKINGLPSNEKTALKAGGYLTVGSGVAGASALTISEFKEFKEKQQIQEEVQETLLNENRLSADQSERASNLLQISFSSDQEEELFFSHFKQCIKSNAEHSACSFLSSNYQLDKEILSLMEKDFHLLQKEEDLNSSGRIYLSLLDQFFSATEISMR